jgi:hypothetical protein
MLQKQDTDLDTLIECGRDILLARLEHHSLQLELELTCRAHQTDERFVSLLPSCGVGKLILANTSSRIIKSMAQPCTHISTSNAFFACRGQAGFFYLRLQGNFKGSTAVLIFPSVPNISGDA